MRIPAQAGFKNFHRSPLAVMGFPVFFVVAAYKVAGYVLAADMTSLAFVALAFAGGAIVLVILNNWRNGLYFFLTWLLFEDFARKYLRHNMALLFVNMILALIIVSLGIAQAIIGHTFWSPQIVAEDIRELSSLYRVSPISGLIMYRPTSVFVSIGRFGNFLLVTWLLVFGFSAYLLLRHKRGRSFAFIVFALTAAGLALCSSRDVVLWSAGSALVGSVAFVWGAPWRQREVLRVLRSVQRTALGIVLGIVILLASYPEALLSRVALYTETLSPSSSASKLQHRTWTYPVANFLGAFSYDRWPYGYGIGTTSLGTQYVARIFHAKPLGVGVENGFGALVLVMGIGGGSLPHSPGC